jgi:3-deoxy-D-manno-octulosonic-acid transferase
MAAAGSLIDALTTEMPSLRLILTTGNQEGRQAAELLREKSPQIAEICYLPWDRHAAMRRWMQRMKPSAVIVIETEIWPNLFRAARDLSIPLFIANGRIYPRDLPRYRLARWFFRPVLASVKWIGVQSEQERSSFLRIGAPADRVEIMGNLKHDIVPSHELDQPWSAAFERLHGEPLIVAGSTHPPEEGWLLEAFDRLRQDVPLTRLVLAPRHPIRADAIRRQATSAGFSAVCWSKGYPADDGWEVLILDQIGVLAAIFRWADVAVVGGSLIRRGGHNPLEAANHSRAIIIGPFHEHFTEIVNGLEQTGGIRVLPRGGDIRQALSSVLQELMRDPRQRREMGCRAFAFAQNHRGVARSYARTLLARTSQHLS